MSKNVADNPARYVALMVEHLEKQRIDCTLALSMAGIDPAQLAHPEARISREQVTVAVRLLSETSGRGDLGFEIGGLIRPGIFGELGRALLSCATLREAIECSATYFELVTPRFSMRTRPVGTRLEICWQPVQPLPYDIMVMGFDIILVSFHRQVELIVPGDLPPYDVYLSFAAPGHVGRYRELKPARCHHGQGGLPALTIDIDAQVLEVPMPLSNTHDLREAARRLGPRLQVKPQQASWTEWVGMMLREAEDCQPTQQELARLVNLSSSTLARYLAAESSSYRELATRVRHERACQWLTEGRISVAEIARRLGYTSVPNFSRAFRLCSGLSPSAYACKHASPPPH